MARHSSDPPELQEDNLRGHFMASDDERRKKHSSNDTFFAAGVTFKEAFEASTIQAEKGKTNKQKSHYQHSHDF